jgi:hypothetical protein
MSQIASTVLMVRPASFGFNTETAANNVFQTNAETLTAAEVQQKALVEFDAFVNTLRANKINVVVYNDTLQPQKPDAIFPNNWFATFATGNIIMFPMFAANRRIEKSDELLHMLSEKFYVKDVQDWSEYEADNFFLEGTGSMIIDHENKIIYACLSPRTHLSLLERFASTHGYKAIGFYSKDENDVEVYHTNVIMHIGEGYAVICLESIKDEMERIAVSQLLNVTGHDIIPISLQQVHAYAGNMLQVINEDGKKFTVLSKQAFDVLTNDQKEQMSKFTNLLPIDINTIETVGGGSVRCMMAEIFLHQKNA